MRRMLGNNNMMKKKKTTKKKNNRSNLSKKISFAKLLEENPDAADILMSRGMHCVGCPMAMQESLEDGAMAHGLDADEIINEIKKSKKKKR